MRRRPDAIAFHDGFVADNMVDMAVCIDDFQRLEAVAVDKAEEAVLLIGIGAARVDDEAFKGILVIKDVGLFHERVEDKGIEFEHDAISNI